MTNGKKIFAYVFCVFIIISSWCICFLPTLFYMNPLETKKSNKHVNLSFLPVSKPSFPCNPPLIFSNRSGFCKPPCDWMPFSEKEQHGMAIADWITAMFCTTCFCFVLVTWFKLPEFMRFPHFIILLIAGTSAFIEIIVVIPKLRKRSILFCTSEFLDEAIENPTIFCDTQGALIHYVSLVIGELFVIYNAFLLKHLVIDKRPNDGYNKKFLTVLFLSVIILPIIPVAYVLKSDEKYTPVYLRYCFPKNADEVYYSCLLPQQLFLSAGITCLLLVTFKLIKERKSTLIGSPRQAQRRQLQLQKIAVQFIVVIISYIASVYLTYGLLCIQLNNRKAYRMSLEKYFKCLVFTNNCAQDFLKYETSYGLIILSLLAGNVFQGGTLILLVGKQKARYLWRSWWYFLTGKCHTMREIPKTASSVQELQPSTCEETKNAVKND